MLVPTLSNIVTAVHSAGKLIDCGFGLPQGFTEKEDGTPVTATDYKINCLFRDMADKHKIGFLGEEGNGNTECDWILYVDPLDGTGAFTRGIPTSTIVASLLFQGEPVMAVIHNPITGQTWMAEEVGYCEYSRNRSAEICLRIEPEASEKYRTAICAWPGVDQPFANFQKKVLESPNFSDQQMGAFGLGGGLIASGLIDATAISTTSAVETAAMSLIVKAAGGVTIDLLGNPINRFELGMHKGKADFLLPHGAILACNEELAMILAALYQQ